MKRTIKIGGKDVVFESNALTPLYFEQEFYRDFFQTIFSLIGNIDEINTGEQKSEGNSSVDLKAAASINYTDIMRLAYACAKTADESIGSFLDWLHENKSFSALEHGLEVLDMLSSSIEAKKK